LRFKVPEEDKKINDLLAELYLNLYSILFKHLESLPFEKNTV